MVKGHILKSLPPEARMWVYLALVLFLNGCGGSSTSPENRLLAVTPILLDAPNSDYIYDSFIDFDGALAVGYAINVNTGELLILSPDDSLPDFLSKQPDPLASLPIFAHEATPYGALAHLRHQIGAGNTPPSAGLNLISQYDPGHFFLWGLQGPAPEVATNYLLETQYYCAHCVETSNSATSYLSVNPLTASAQMRMTTNELAITLPLQLSDEMLIADYDSSAVSIRQNDVPKDDAIWHAFGNFFGPSAEQAGLLFSLSYDDQIISAAGIGSATP